MQAPTERDHFYSTNIIHIKYTIANKNDIFSSPQFKEHSISFLLLFLLFLLFFVVYLVFFSHVCLCVCVFLTQFYDIDWNCESNKKMLSDGHWRPKHKIEKVKMHLKIQSTQINNQKGALNNDAKNERKKTRWNKRKQSMMLMMRFQFLTSMNFRLFAHIKTYKRKFHLLFISILSFNDSMARRVLVLVN